MYIFLVKSESCGHVGLEDLCDGVDVGRCPDVEAKIHPDGHMVTMRKNCLSVCNNKNFNDADDATYFENR